MSCALNSANLHNLILNYKGVGFLNKKMKSFWGAKSSKLHRKKLRFMPCFYILFLQNQVHFDISQEINYPPPQSDLLLLPHKN